MAFCSQCGFKLMDNDRFCHNCGNPISDRQQIIISRNEDSNTIIETAQNGASTLKKGLSIVFLIVSLIYAFVLPIDVVPDVVPIAGWLDDMGLVAIAGLNVLQQYIQDQKSATVKIIKILKWILIVLVAIVVLLLGGLIAFIISLFK